MDFARLYGLILPSLAHSVESVHGNIELEETLNYPKP